ncbi:UNVERIFIED_CONTAM: hypothetical protein FKN15_005450 [Acipenser sinensis]
MTRGRRRPSGELQGTQERCVAPQGWAHRRRHQEELDQPGMAVTTGSRAIRKWINEPVESKQASQETGM